MHLADGILTQTPAVLCLNAGGALGVAAALARLRKTRSAPAWTGTLAAFVLVAQAINFPIAPGASAHVIGTALLTLTLGPARAIVALCAVLLVQALLFADGGLTVLGLNALTMALLPALIVHSVRRVAGESPRGLAVTAVVGSAAGACAGALTLSLALAAGARAPFVLTASWLVSVQTLAGLVEGVLTAVAVRELARRAPALLYEPTAPTAPRPRMRTAVVLACAGLAMVAVLPWASSLPDALSVVLHRLRIGP